MWLRLQHRRVCFQCLDAFFLIPLHLSSLGNPFVPCKASNNIPSFHERVPSLPSEVGALHLVQPSLSMAEDVLTITYILFNPTGVITVGG